MWCVYYTLNHRSLIQDNTILLGPGGHYSYDTSHHIFEFEKMSNGYRILRIRRMSFYITDVIS